MGNDISYRFSLVEMDVISSFLEGIKLHLLGFGQWKETDVGTLERFTLSCFQITYIHQGSSRIVSGDRECVCPSESIFLFEPFRVYSASSVGTEKLMYSYLPFDISPYSMRSRFEAMTIGNGNGAFIEQGFEQFGTMLRSLHTNFQDDPLGRLAIIKLAVLRIIIHMMRKQISKDNSLLPRLDSTHIKIVDEAISYTEKNLNKPIKIAQLAYDIGVSESTLYKVFMQMFSLSPSKFLTQYKIRKGEQLILTQQLTIEEVSERLGYSSSSHFSKTFKSVLGRKVKT